MPSQFRRSEFVAGLAEMAPPLVGIVPFGVVCGVASQVAGFNLAEAAGLAAIVFSGAAQILICQLTATQAPVAVIVVTCLVIGLRFMMYSAAMAPYLKAVPPRWRNVLAFGLTDQVFATVIRRFAADSPAPDRVSFFLGAGVALWACWLLANIAGFLAGNVIPATWSLEFVVPLCFVSLLVPALDDGPTRVAAATAAVAVVGLDALPMRLSVIVAGLAGIAAGVAAAWLGRRVAPRRST